MLRGPRIQILRLQLPEGQIDPYGIAPDVYMPAFMDDPYPFILEHLETMSER